MRASPDEYLRTQREYEDIVRVPLGAARDAPGGRGGYPGGPEAPEAEAGGGCSQPSPFVGGTRHPPNSRVVADGTLSTREVEERAAAQARDCGFHVRAGGSPERDTALLSMLSQHGAVGAADTGGANQHQGAVQHPGAGANPVVGTVGGDPSTQGAPHKAKAVTSTWGLFSTQGDSGATGARLAPSSTSVEELMTGDPAAPPKGES
jgi:hypothetical protein